MERKFEKWTYLVACILLTFVPNIDGVVIYDANICDETSTAGFYEIPIAKKCKPQKLESIKTCQTQVFELNRLIVPIKAYACTVEIKSQKTYLSFFGTRTETPIDTIKITPSVAMCMAIHESKMSTLAGKLQKIDETLYATSNKLKLYFYWLSETSFRVYNVYLEYMHIYYNFVEDQIVKDTILTEHCDIKLKTCISNGKRLIWNNDETDFCDELNTAKIYVGNSILQLDDHQELISIKIPELSSVYKNLMNVSSRYLTCFTKEDMILIDIDGILIQLNSCRKLVHSIKQIHMSNNLAEILHLHNVLADNIFSNKTIYNSQIDLEFINKHSQTHFYEISSTLPGELNFIMSSLTQLISRLEDKLDFLSCELNRQTSFNTKLLARKFPKTVLNFMLDDNGVSAKTQGDILRAQNCIQVNVTLKSTLHLAQDIFATRPLGYITTNGKDVLFQFNMDNLWSRNIVYITRNPETRLMTFRINDVLVSYQNNSLLNKAPNIKKLSPRQTNYKLNITKTDFSIARIFLGDRLINDESDFSVKTAINALKFDGDTEFISSLDFWKTAQKTNIERITEKHSPVVQKIKNAFSPFMDFFSGLFKFLQNLYVIPITIIVVWIIYQLCKIKCTGKKNNKNKTNTAATSEQKEINNTTITQKQDKVNTSNDKIKKNKSDREQRQIAETSFIHIDEKSKAKKASQPPLSNQEKKRTTRILNKGQNSQLHNRENQILNDTFYPL